MTMDGSLDLVRAEGNAHFFYTIFPPSPHSGALFAKSLCRIDGARVSTPGEKGIYGEVVEYPDWLMKFEFSLPQIRSS